jgi:hypothetical protein
LVVLKHDGGARGQARLQELLREDIFVAALLRAYANRVTFVDRGGTASAPERIEFQWEAMSELVGDAPLEAAMERLAGATDLLEDSSAVRLALRAWETRLRDSANVDDA